MLSIAGDKREQIFLATEREGEKLRLAAVMEKYRQTIIVPPVRFKFVFLTHATCSHVSACSDFSRFQVLCDASILGYAFLIRFSGEIVYDLLLDDGFPPERWGLVVEHMRNLYSARGKTIKS